ncbi:MAG: T9SS type A sorting domain-containing protein [Hyphomicrobiales bacterium]
MNKRLFTKKMYSYMLLIVVIIANQTLFANTQTTRGVTKIKDIPNQEVEIGVDRPSINLNEYFSKGEGESIQYEIENDNPSIVNVSFYGDHLVMTPRVSEAGVANITVIAYQNEEEAARASFTITVKKAKANLRLLESIADRELRMNGNRIQLNMLQYFTSNPTFDINYTVSVAGDNLIEASFAENMLDIISTSGNVGRATVSLTATSGDESLTEEFYVDVKNVATEIVKIKDFEDISMQNTDAAYEFDMTEYFTCNAAYNLSYVGYSWNTSLAYVSLEGNKIKLNLYVNQSGTSRIEIKALAGGDELKTSFLLTVSNSDVNLVKVNDIPAQSMQENGAALTINLSEYFTCAEGHTIIYGARATNPSIAALSLDGSTLTLTAEADQSGSTDITVEARVGAHRLESTFTLTITEAVAEVNLVKVSDVPAQSMQENGAALTVDLSQYFTCSEEYTIIYSASISDATIATATVEGHTLTIAAIADQSGTANITVEAKVGEDKVESTFALTITEVVDEVNLVKVNDIPAQSMQENGTALTVDLSEYFTCAEGHTIVYSVNIAGALIATTSIEGNTLTIAAKADMTGTANITVEAKIGEDKVSSTFVLTIEPASGVGNVEVSTLKVYPNPVTNYFIVNSPEAGSVEVYTNQGALINTYEVNRNSNRIEVGDLTSGIYFVKLISGDSISVGKILVK